MGNLAKAEALFTQVDDTQLGAAILRPAERLSLRAGICETRRTRSTIISRSNSAFCGSPQNAEFEREILRERVRAGLAHARQNGQRLGRPLTAAIHTDQVRKLFRAGISKSEIARRLAIGRTSVRRILASK